MISEERIRRIAERRDYLEAAMAEGGSDIAELAREYSGLKPVMERVAEWRRIQGEIAEAESMLDDPDMKELASQELSKLREELPDAEMGLRLALLPRDAADERPAVLEIRPGTGGEEAALFAADLMRMYQRHAESRGWSFETIDLQETELGGIRELVAVIRGEGAFARLKHESGVHRVQRIPATESGGRIHTSAATVAVLPEATDVDMDIPASDIRVETMRASGAGGQHVNTTDSAVRITHLPTGVTATSSEKSQHRNRDIALQLLRSRLFDAERQKRDSERSADRAAQVGTGDRSERIRTYNFPQGRVTDHRINLTLHKLERVMQGDLDEIADALVADAQTRLLLAEDG